MLLALYCITTIVNSKHPDQSRQAPCIPDTAWSGRQNGPLPLQNHPWRLSCPGRSPRGCRSTIPERQPHNHIHVVASVRILPYRFIVPSPPPRCQVKNGIWSVFTRSNRVTEGASVWYHENKTGEGSSLQDEAPFPSVRLTRLTRLNKNRFPMESISHRKANITGKLSLCHLSNTLLFADPSFGLG